jgi:hypothetical protein
MRGDARRSRCGLVEGEVHAGGEGGTGVEEGQGEGAPQFMHADCWFLGSITRAWQFGQAPSTTDDFTCHVFLMLKQ